MTNNAADLLPCRDVLECWLDSRLGLHLESGDLIVATVTCMLGLFVIVATIKGVDYAARQFKVANTIRYMERFSDPNFKKMVDEARNDNEKHGFEWRTYGLTTDHSDIKFNADRISFARKAKEIANYFDYVGVLMSRGQIDRDLFFSQLCDVTIENWKWLRPYIYYARMWRGDPFTLKYKALFESAAQTLEGDEAAVDALHDLNRALGRLTDHARTGADYQLWFEWLYLKAIAWRNEPKGLPSVHADPSQIPSVIAGIGKTPQPQG